MQMKNSFACAVAVAVLLLAFVAAVTAQSNQYPPIPGSTNAMNMGYDRVTGQISHLPVFMFFNNDGLTWKPASNSDVTYAVPDELFVANTDESQELVVQVLTESYEKFLTAYAESFGIDLGISVGALSLGFKFDHSLSNAHMELTDDHAAVGYSHHWYSIYSLTLAPPNLLQLHPWFKAELGQLPPTITTAADQAAYDAFICNFGTDYISWANFGIRVDVQTFVNSTIFDTYSAEWVANQISLTFHYLMFDISPSYFKNQSQIHISDQFLSQARTYVHFIGGNPLYQNNDTLTQWVDSMMYYPHYLNITTIALNTIVPDAQVAATLAQEINAYATSGGHLANPCSTSGITKRAKFPKMRDSSSSSSGTTATTATTATSKAANANANANDAKVQAKAKAFKPMATGTAAATVNHLFRDAQKAAPTNQGNFH